MTDLNCPLTDPSSSAQKWGLNKVRYRRWTLKAGVASIFTRESWCPFPLRTTADIYVAKQQRSLFPVGMNGMSELYKLKDLNQMKDRQQTKAVDHT